MLFWFTLFQGEIGEKGQKVNTMFIHKLFLHAVLLVCDSEIWSFEILIERNDGETLCLYCGFQGEPGIGHRGPEGQAGPPGQKVKLFFPPLS